MGGPESEHGLGRGGSRQPAMGPQPEVVPKSLLQPAFEIVSKERRSRPKRADRLQGPEPLDEGDGAGLADGAVTVVDVVAGEGDVWKISVVNWGPWSETEWRGTPKRRTATEKRRPISTALGSERKTRATSGLREKTSKTTASLKEKRRRRPGISVEHPDVVGVAGPDPAGVCRREGWQRWAGHGPLPADALDGPAMIRRCHPRERG